MKTVILTISILITSYSSFSQEILTNNTIIQLVKLNLGNNIIINKIETSKNSFNVSTDTLIWLKSQNIPDDVISSMIKAANNINNMAININDPTQYHPSGIYYYREINNNPNMSELEPAVVSQSKTRGLWGNAFSYGISNLSKNAVLSGANAHFQILENRPVFYFYFNQQQQSLTTSSGTLSGNAIGKATSPNEFILIKAAKKGNDREFPMSSQNISGEQSGVSSKNQTGFQFQKLSDGVYKIYFNEDLPSGEYAFMYAGMTAGSTGNSTLYDFSIPKSKR